MRKYSFYLLLLLVLGLSSCEKVIDLDLKSSDNRLVIEGIVNNEELAQVRISRVIDYDKPNSFVGVSQALVILTDNTGLADTLKEDTMGWYLSDTIIGIPGRTYSLLVQVEGKIYTSTCNMPETVTLDSLSAEEQFFFGDTSYTINCFFNDPGNVKNYYRYLYSVNAFKDENYLVEKDEFYNGTAVKTRLFNFGLSALPGDSVAIELWGIDPAMYKYYLTLSAAINSASGQQAAPANPESNITGGAIGYFSAHTISRASIFIPE